MTSTSPANNFLSRAADLIDRGFSVIPLATREKRPVPGIGAKERTRDMAKINAWGKMFPDANAGICSDDDITILESDDMLSLDLQVADGERHYTLMSLAGLLHDGERSAEDIAEILRSVRDEYFSAGKGDEEIERVAEHAVRRAPLYLEPRVLPEAFMVGLRIFNSQGDMENWVKEHQDDFSVAWGVFAAEDLPEQRVLITLKSVPLIAG
jgi:hypothetical protein